MWVLPIVAVVGAGVVAGLGLFAWAVYVICDQEAFGPPYGTIDSKTSIRAIGSLPANAAQAHKGRREERAAIDV